MKTDGTYAQEPKPGDDPLKRNHRIKGPLNMPGRSSHSSLSPNKASQEAKGNTVTSATPKATVSKRALTNANLRMVIMRELDQYTFVDKKKGKYNGLIRIISKPEFLLHCYLLIKGKPGNITPGIDKFTLDGLDYD